MIDPKTPYSAVDFWTDYVAITTKPDAPRRIFPHPATAIVELRGNGVVFLHNAFALLRRNFDAPTRLRWDYAMGAWVWDRRTP